MTESEKAQLGQLYNANHDPQLLNKRTWAKNLCMEYNQLRWDEGAKRTALLQELLGICGEDAVIEPPFYVDYGKNICIGRGFYANHNLVILDGATVTIGNNVFIGPNCTIFDRRSPLRGASAQRGTRVREVHHHRQQCLDRHGRADLPGRHDRRPMRSSAPAAS